MWRQKWALGLVVLFSLLLSGPPVWACGGVGPNGHVGEALRVNPSDRAIQIRDAQTGDRLTFRATEKQLSGINPGDRVLIRYKRDGESLIAEEVERLR
ncbi:MAG: hypothetical protein ACE5G5_07285 [Candidatus Methylomirabilales bacterium]